MNLKSKILGIAIVIGLLFSCNSKTKDQVGAPGVMVKETPAATPQAKADVPPSQQIDLQNKGVGPIISMELGPINQAMAAKGQEIFKNMCTACHKPTKKFIGPAPLGILERRSPEWVMNMILDPNKMTTQDPLAMELLKEFNGAPMANQNLSEQDARAVLEYFRTL